ncbi:MAG: O-methyltransferase [Myxococcaceae bacterium]|nr:O-methyltransferase [Myxococcaceae bacterium]
MKTADAMAPWATANKLAWAPLMFHAAKAARDLKVLLAVEQAKGGATREEVAATTNLSLYAAGVLLDTCEAMDLLERKEDRFRLLPAGWLVEHDPMTRIHMDFNADCNYRGAEFLKESLVTGKPVGLKTLSGAPHIYEALSELPEPAKTSWFKFDHFYSDQVFPLAKPMVLQRKPKSLLDVGGNTGKFALLMGADVPVTILDHPGQLNVAMANAKAAGLQERVKGIEMDLLDHSRPFPANQDAVWMSQFVCCFGLDDIVALLRRGAQALSKDGRLYVLDTFWDRQKNPVAAYCLHATSLYFTAMANGTSRIYSAPDLIACAKKAGLVVEEDLSVGHSHTLLVCKPG